MTELLATVEITDACVDSNSIVLGNTSHADPQTFILNQDDEVLIDLPTMNDQYSVSDGDGAALCGSIVFTMDVEFYGDSISKP